MTDYLSFKLSPSFVDSYRDKEVPWGFVDAAGSPVSEIIFFRTYSRKKDDGSKETWVDACERVINGMYSLQKDYVTENRLPWNDNKAHRSAEEAFDRMFNFKWTPPGRGIWMMGTELVNKQRNSAALQNPLHEDTKVLTRDGWRRLGDLEGQDVELLSSTFLYGRDNVSNNKTSKWVKGSVSMIEEQPSIEIVYNDTMGNEHSVIASRNHRWFTRRAPHNSWKRVSGDELRPGDLLPVVKPRINFLPSHAGMQHGFFFGDGSRTDGEFQQFGASSAVMARLFGDQVQYTSRYSRVGQCPLAWGHLPEGRYLEDQRYVYGFLSGYFAADGSVSKDGQCTISSARRDELEAVRDLFMDLGIQASPVRLSSTSSNYSNDRELWKITLDRFDLQEEFFLKLDHKERWLVSTFGKDRHRNHARIKEVRDAGVQRVLCATVPHYEQFVTENFVLTSNCAFLSTSDIHKNDPGAAFGWLMEASMLGVGVGFDTKGSGKDITITSARWGGDYRIPDTREGWVESTRLLINAYLSNGELPDFDYSQIRPAGEPIKTFGGTAAGPEPLIKLHDKLTELFESKIGEKLDSLTIMDIANLIGVCVVSGNVRRSAELAMGSLDDEDFLTAKDYGKHPERMEWGWMSNNSVEAKVGDDLSHIVDNIALNGEPGVIWMDVTRDHGRLIDPPDYKDYRAQGYNPCAEQSLESFEMCVSGETRIQTEDGLHKIKDVVGQTVRVWNGEEWAEVTPFSTGVNELYRVTFSDGSYLDATPGHEWSVKTPTGRKFQKLQTKDLSVGMVLPEFHLESPDGKHNENAYTYGWVAGDGYIDGNRVMALVKSDEYRVLPLLGGTVYKEQSFNNDSEVRYSRVNVSDMVPFDAAVAMRREDRLPEEVFTWDAESVSDFMGGWIDTDGSLIQNPNTDHYVLYGSEGKLREAQILLRRIGVNHASLRLFSEKGVQTNKGVRNQDLYRLLIPSYEADRINTRVKVATRFGDRNRVNNAHPDGNRIDSARKQKIVSIEKISDAADTYCFNEPKRGMGVFGNVLTYQCTLVETFLNRHESKEDFLRTLKFAFLYAKTVTLLPTHWGRTNAVMQRNRRIGVGTSGHANFVDNHGMPELREWLDLGYHTVNIWDREYSEWLGVRESIKKTTVKPSGTVSLLAGESPGVHWSPGGEYHLRGVVFQKDDPMVALFRQAGYEIQESAYTPDTSVFVQFPIHSKAKRSEKDVTIFEKINLAVNAQRYWSDNSVSVTVSFDAKDEAEFVPTVLQMHEGSLKTVSFLPQGNDTYAQMPYVSIEEDEYLDLQDNLLKVDLSSVYRNGLDAEGERGCTTDACEVPKA